MYVPQYSTKFPWCTINARAAFACCIINIPVAFAWCMNHFVHKVGFSYIGWNGVHPLCIYGARYPRTVHTMNCPKIGPIFRPIVKCRWKQTHIYCCILFTCWVPHEVKSSWKYATKCCFALKFICALANTPINLALKGLTISHNCMLDVVNHPHINSNINSNSYTPTWEITRDYL